MMMLAKGVKIMVGYYLLLITGRREEQFREITLMSVHWFECHRISERPDHRNCRTESPTTESLLVCLLLGCSRRVALFLCLNVAHQVHMLLPSTILHIKSDIHVGLSF